MMMEMSFVNQSIFIFKKGTREMNNEPVMEMCDEGHHKFYKLPDHPRNSLGNSVCPYCLVIGKKKLENEISELKHINRNWQILENQLLSEMKALRDFVRPIVVHGDDCIGNWDGGELQDLAVKTGLLIEVEKTEACNLGKEEFVGCPCREYNYGEESWTCYQTVKFLIDEA